MKIRISSSSSDSDRAGKFGPRFVMTGGPVFVIVRGLAPIVRRVFETGRIEAGWQPLDG
ncbi:MAG: hypothetical protein JSS81_12550 [Acidobacteria bacterium]|nr:hypothetical protein [Acidobacteriota bacterium]